MSIAVPVVGQGDSITFGVQGYFDSALGSQPSALANGQISDFVRNCYPLTGVSGVTGVNCATSGSRLSDWLAAPAISLVDGMIQGAIGSPRQTTYANRRPNWKPVFTLLAGSNDDCIGGFATPADYADAVGAYCLARRNSGYVGVILITPLPRGDGSPNYESNRQGYITRLLSAGWTTTFGVTGLCRFDQNAIMGFDGSWNTYPTYWNADKIHPTALGFSAGGLTSQFLASVNSEYARLLS